MDEPAAPKHGTIIMGDDGKPKKAFWFSDEDLADAKKKVEELSSHSTHADQPLNDDESDSDLAE